MVHHPSRNNLHLFLRLPVELFFSLRESTQGLTYAYPLSSTSIVYREKFSELNFMVFDIRSGSKAFHVFF